MTYKETKFYLAENVNNAVGNLDKNMTYLELFHQTKMCKGGGQKKSGKEDQGSEWMSKSRFR